MSRGRNLPKSTKKQLRALWLQVHKWIGLLLAVLIIPISVTGSALVWHDWLDAKLDPQRHVIIAPAGLAPSAYAATVAAQLAPDQLLTSLRFSPEGEPVLAVAQKAARGPGRPERTNFWLDPRDARLIDRAPANAGVVRVLHGLHGSMMIPGGWGRPIVGWVGIFMLVSCLTGLWLWWPLRGGFRSGFRWKRRNTANANLHYMTGFWILIPLAMLSFTGAWISFPKVFSQFESGSTRMSGGPRGGGGPSQPMAETRISADAALAAATPLATGPLLSIGWPTDRQPEWSIRFENAGPPSEVKVADASPASVELEPIRPETLARKIRRWHDGTDMGPVWQIVIFLGGIIPALLSVTGIIIWWRARASRRRARPTAVALSP
ncbi:PepSY-associated TM helix domain-containing protein [Sphingosinicella rhizophila]|uniref:PepSY-associated TM helix domain-containing protein n=1 Tax=Sphingosinicella rhizophila TaxID=3050082 RepID=A0ABU3Q4Q8_9SPHN|nr:PepSY-associated TM helix domain-containing protein [Sphingosinicella sp. GR2756]MDT9598386.1 PepSY-associated TM helix domain-containing protein [Sphingosinicella sp. GR2756]